MLGSRWRQRKLSINILPNYSMKPKGVAFAVWAPTPTVLAWLAPSIIGTADAMLCAIITIAHYDSGIREIFVPGISPGELLPISSKQSTIEP
jgi:hypothetical protein